MQEGRVATTNRDHLSWSFDLGFSKTIGFNLIKCYDGVFTCHETENKYPFKIIHLALFIHLFAQVKL